MIKKFRIIFLIVSIIFIIIFLTFILLKRKNNSINEVEEFHNIEVQPEEEVPETSNYETNIKLFLIDPTSGILTGEDVVLDARELVDNPYKYIINLLINPPDSLKVESAIPKGTKINNCVINKGVLTVDLSSEFLNSSGTNSIYSIVNTMSQFNEIDSVIFRINGEENNQLKEKFIKNI